MESSFADAAIGEAPQKLVFTSDWDKTLLCDSFNFELLQFLSDAKRNGHRVIITSSMQMDNIKTSLAMFIRSAARRGYNIAELGAFEFICKAELKTMNLTSDYSFDDEPIAKQLYKNYVNAKIEVTIQKDGSPYPFSFDQLRDRCNIPRTAKKGSEQILPAPALKAFGDT